jgi:hypothetical protein
MKHVDGVQRKQLDFIKRTSFDKKRPSTSRAAARLHKKQKKLLHEGSSSEDGTSQPPLPPFPPLPPLPPVSSIVPRFLQRKLM